MICLRAWCGAAAFALLVPTVAAAQPGNPFTNLFGRAPLDTGKEYTAVQFRTTAGVQWGQTLADESQPDAALPEGLAGVADASLLGEYMRERVQLAGHGRYSYNAYRQDRSYGGAGFNGGGRVNFQATTRLSFQGNAQFVRSPFFQLAFLDPGLYAPPTVPADNGAILLVGSDSIEGSAGVTHQLTQRSGISALAFARETRFDDGNGYDFSTRGARGLWRRTITRSLGVHAGYGREELRQTNAGVRERYTNELLDIGIDFAKAFTMGRKTTLAFTTETSMVRENSGPREVRLNGSVDLQRRFLRSWSASVGARRATEFVPGFRAPLFTERGSASLAGYLATRLMLEAQANASRGAIGLGDARSFRSYLGGARLTVAASRNIGIFTQYTYNHYQMPPDSLALFAAPRLSRQAVLIGVNTFVQLLDKKKVPVDSR